MFLYFAFSLCFRALVPKCAYRRWGHFGFLVKSENTMANKSRIKVLPVSPHFRFSFILEHFVEDNVSPPPPPPLHPPSPASPTADGAGPHIGGGGGPRRCGWPAPGVGPGPHGIYINFEDIVRFAKFCRHLWDFHNTQKRQQKAFVRRSGLFNFHAPILAVNMLKTKNSLRGSLGIYHDMLNCYFFI